MADFELAVNKTIANEGGDKYTETPDDNGGATKYGISMSFVSRLFLDGKLNDEFLINSKFLFNILCIKNLTLEQAKFFYKKYFWDANRYGEINDQAIAEKVFDLGVLFGDSTVNKAIQNTINKCNGDLVVSEDGIIGNQTLEYLNNRYGSTWVFKVDFEYYMIKKALDICNKNKTQEQFLLDWLNRVVS